MSKIVVLNFDPDEKTLRHFGYIALVGFGLLGLSAWTESVMFGAGLGSARTPVAYSLLSLAAISLLFSLVAPSLNKGIFVLLSVVTYPIGFVMSYVIMGILFFLVIAPIALVMRLVGFDPLKRAYDKKAASYYSATRAGRSKESYFKQY